MIDTRTPAELQEAMEAARLDFELWRRGRSRTVINEGPEPTLREEYPEKYAGLKADEVNNG
jgi:hypothetical protein